MPATTLSIMEDPQCLIENGPDGKLTVSASILDELKSLDKEVVVVTIAGPYRTGKSYLLNRLAGKTKGFALGSTIQSKTKGIWVWVRDHPKLQDKYLVLLDTEGLGDVEKGDENHDNQILCLSVLLASTLVYNVMGVIGNDAIQKLHFITEVAKHIQVKSHQVTGANGSSDNDANFDYYFPDFVYAIRDFGLDLEIDGREVTADEYLEHSLTMKPGDRPEVKTYNKIRECIRKYFKKRKCFTFITPVAGKCKFLDETPDEKLLPEFRLEAAAFVNYIFESSPVKQIGGKKLTGRMLASLLEVYVEQMKTGMPYVENAVDQMAKVENTQAVKDAVGLYNRLMSESLKMPVVEDSEFSRCHNEALAKTVEYFLSRAVFDHDQVFQTEMNEEIKKVYQDLKNQNETVCKDICQAALEKLYAPIREKLANGHYTKSGGFQIYKNDMTSLVETYEKEGGPIAAKMRHVLLEFLNARKAEEDAILQADKMVTVAEKKEEEERQRAVEMEKKKQEAERSAELQRQTLEDQARAHAENVKQLETKLREEAAAARNNYEEMLQKRMAEQQRLLQEGFKRESDQMQARINDLQSQMKKQKGGGGGGIICTIL